MRWLANFQSSELQILPLLTVLSRRSACICAVLTCVCAARRADARLSAIWLAIIGRDRRCLAHRADEALYWNGVLTSVVSQRRADKALYSSGVLSSVVSHSVVCRAEEALFWNSVLVLWHHKALHEKQVLYFWNGVLILYYHGFVRADLVFLKWYFVFVVCVMQAERWSDLLEWCCVFVASHSSAHRAHDVLYRNGVLPLYHNSCVMYILDKVISGNGVCPGSETDATYAARIEFFSNLCFVCAVSWMPCVRSSAQCR